MLEKLHQKRHEMLNQHKLNNVFNKIADELREIIDTKHKTLNQLTEQTRESNNQHHKKITEQTMNNQHIQLDLLPPNLTNQIRELQEYDFVSSKTHERFEQLIKKLREQLMQRFLNQMSENMQNMSPKQMQQIKNIITNLNEMLTKRERDKNPSFEQFMNEFKNFFPKNPQTLDELLENITQRITTMQQILNSITPKQQHQLQELNEQLLNNINLTFQINQLNKHMRSLFPQIN